LIFIYFTSTTPNLAKPGITMNEKTFLLEDKQNGRFTINNQLIPAPCNEALHAIFNYHYLGQKNHHQRMIDVVSMGNHSFFCASYFLAESELPARRRPVNLADTELMGLLVLFEGLLFPNLQIINWQQRNDKIFIIHKPKAITTIDNS